MKTQLVLTLLFIAVYCFGISSAKVVWRMKPMEVIALRGNMVMLNCFVDGRNVTSPGDHKFWWYRTDRNMIISKNSQVMTGEPASGRYTVLLDKYRGVYSLVIRNVSESDGGLYQCHLKQSRNSPQEVSDNASLTVLMPPSHGYEPCKVFKESGIILSPAGNRALQCPKSTDSFWSIGNSNQPANESVYHSWKMNKQVLHAFFLQNKTTLLSESVSSGNVQSTAYCAVNSSMLQQSPNRCHLIIRSKTASALVYPPLTDIQNGDSVNFTCSHRDVAVAIDYTWDLPPELSLAGIKFIKNGETIVLENVKGEWGKMINIVCHVTTEWGTKANATATIAFLHKTVTKPGVEITSTKEEASTAEVIGPHLPNESQNPKLVPSRSGNPALKNISILIGPALGVIILFLLAVIFALCITKRKSASRHKVKLSHQLSSSLDPQKSVTLRSVGKPSNRNSRASRRFSDSFTYRFSRDCEYENIEAYMAKKGQFLGGISSFQDENNTPMEANVRVKIEMPSSLSTSMPALNACKISSNFNGHAIAEDQQQTHYNPSLSHGVYKPLANGNPYATREQLGFPSLISQEIREAQHYHEPTTHHHHAVIDKPKKAMKPPNPPPRKPSYW